LRSQLKTTVSLSVFVGFFVIISMSCSYLNPFDRNSEMVNVGPAEWHSLVVYFRSGATDEQVGSFIHSVLFNPRSDGRGEDFKEGIGEFIALDPTQGNGHRGFAITFYKKATNQQRSMIKESIRANELVYMVFENIAPNDIKESDLK
jgi:hypothetical protein